MDDIGPTIEVTVARRKPTPTSEVDADADTLRAVARELIDEWSKSPQITVGRAKAERLLTIHGLVAHAVRMADAALTLTGQDLYVEATPLVRVAYEHAIVAQRVNADAEGLTAFQALTKRDSKRYFKAALPLTSSFANVPEDLIRDYEVMAVDTAATKAVAKFQDTCDAFDPSGWLYLIYRGLSRPVHPSATAATEYVLEDANPSGYVLLNSLTAEEHRLILFPLTLSVALAVGVYEDLRKGKPNKARIRGIANRAGAPTILKLAPKT